MIAAQHRRPVRLSAYRRVLLVLAVLAGVFAMHGLAAGTAAPQPHAGAQSHAGGAHGARAVAHTVHVAGDACEHLDEAGSGQGGAGHLDHADATCAAGGVSTAPAPAPLAPSGVEPAAALAPPSRPAAGAATDRAPPDLAQLQLLRI
ncbi:DUF6153 family protein [Streptomyces sp. NPDC006307]|uniref:DUF6153 family protein n=1 Tax=Streptomyces sp. NPDC006307 TaxID=3156748 RepID=UPI0033A67165